MADPFEAKNDDENDDDQANLIPYDDHAVHKWMVKLRVYIKSPPIRNGRRRFPLESY